MTAACLRHPVVNSKEAARVFPIKKRKPQGRCSFTLCALSSLGTVVPFFLKRKSKLSPLLAAAAPPLLSIFCLCHVAMAPKTGKGKGKGAAKDVVEKEAPENEAAARRAQFAYFSSSSIDIFHLKDVFRPLWA